MAAPIIAGPPFAGAALEAAPDVGATRDSLGFAQQHLGEHTTL
ncbi:hypothetical protein [Streptomyces sp. SP17KL33]|nr:hypothetical protein [Streptomyces sp. SP17KL33]MEE1836164.1 hypothetical protein [Streptomyces sp. SP17KL33]